MAVNSMTAAFTKVPPISGDGDLVNGITLNCTVTYASDVSGRRYMIVFNDVDLITQAAARFGVDPADVSVAVDQDADAGVSLIVVLTASGGNIE